MEPVRDREAPALPERVPVPEFEGVRLAVPDLDGVPELLGEPGLVGERLVVPDLERVPEGEREREGDTLGVTLGVPDLLRVGVGLLEAVMEPVRDREAPALPERVPVPEFEGVRLAVPDLDGVPERLGEPGLVGERLAVPDLEGVRERVGV